ncbi:LysR family transcriptional regulator [Devosia sp. Leaf420]|uniref:LysR family transcriptional regulator n=1 Tax=Devosia sp. Leaf420 TaxID=1736374 RepID=UPI000713F670|nr:LysR family transcriptional regulator [Devosia sp. Leaf420]KQT47048.1 LysR family transcriptional regulator [Devosia sp. Leaf420]
MDRNQLNDLSTFAVIAREGSFTRAASILGMSTSALSHAMRGLETRLGVRLLSRTTRSVAPTEAGAHLLATLGPALRSIEEGLQGLDDWRGSPTGTVRITTFAWVAEKILEPKLPAFLLANPGIRVEVEIEDALVDIVAAGFDAGIRFGETLDKDMVAVRVGPDLRTIVVATPDYFARIPPPVSPYDLDRHECIGYRLTTSGGLLPWEFRVDGKDIKVRTTGPLVVNDGALAASAIRAGVGLGYIMEEEVIEDLAAGRLVQVLDEYCPSFPGCYLYRPSRRQSPPALRALIEALRVR